jgi:hypothetical protein
VIKVISQDSEYQPAFVRKTEELNKQVKPQQLQKL